MTAVAERFNHLREGAQKFHRQYPGVWELFVLFTLDRIHKGFKHYSADAIMHRVRWETDAARGSGSREKFKINNNYVTFYARRFAKTYPHHADFFRFRALRSEEE